MSTESRTPFQNPREMLRASVPALALALSVVFAPVTLAETTEGTDGSGETPAETTAQSLRESPVHVDPAYEEAFAVEARERVAERIGESDLDLYVIVVPITEGDTWNGESEAVASTVHDRMGGQNLIPTQLESAVEAAMADHHEERGTGDDVFALTTPMDPVLRNAGLIILVGLVGLGLYLLLVRKRRRSAAPVAQHAAFDNADRARLESIVESGARDLIELGERLQAADEVDPQALSRSLDARDAAARVHDRMVAEGPTLPDAVGVLVLLDLAEDALVGLRVQRRPCYANPLHGTGTKATQWREFGGSRTIRVPLCAECARAVRGRVRSTVLPARHDGEEIPYFEVPARDSVWAATGYGTLRNDLVERVLRGDHAGRR